MDRTPITIVPGFLGSGKTTLLSSVLQNSLMKHTAVIVNEFGEISLDHDLIAHTVDNIIELNNGCICCTIRGDLVFTLRDLYEKRLLKDIAHFDHVVVETTGIADPVPLVHTIITNPPLQKGYFIDSVITMLDASNAERTIHEHESAARQLAIADIIVIAKTDLVSKEESDRVGEMARALNPGGDIQQVILGDIAPEKLFLRHLFEPRLNSEHLNTWLNCEDRPNSPIADTHSEHYSTHAIVTEKPLSLAGTSVFLNRIINEKRDDILRIKGIAPFREKHGMLGVFHCVQDKFYPVQWVQHKEDVDQKGRFVFISKGIENAYFNRLFDGLCV